MAKGKKTPVETAHKTSELFKQGLSIADIVRETGVPQATVSRLCHKLDEKEEPAPSANDTSSNSKEEITSPNSISEIPADVNPADEIAGSDGFCCEVTGDTDMEAYMAEREKFLAAPKGVPTIVWEACMEKMEELRGKIKAAQDDIAAWAKEIDEISAFLAENTIPLADEEVRQ